MATKKTSMFTLTERIRMQTTGPVFATIDLGSYVDVGDRQALKCIQLTSYSKATLQTPIWFQTLEMEEKY